LQEPYTGVEALREKPVFYVILIIGCMAPGDSHWCAGDLWAVVSAERNATIVRFPLAGAMHLKCKPEEKGSFLRPFYIKVHGTWSFLDGWVKMSGRIDI
jgi:hypothetical protein